MAFSAQQFFDSIEPTEDSIRSAIESMSSMSTAFRFSEVRNRAQSLAREALARLRDGDVDGAYLTLTTGEGVANASPDQIISGIASAQQSLQSEYGNVFENIANITDVPEDMSEEEIQQKYDRANTELVQLLSRLGLGELSGSKDSRTIVLDEDAVSAFTDLMGEDGVPEIITKAVEAVRNSGGSASTDSIVQSLGAVTPEDVSEGLTRTDSGYVQTEDAASVGVSTVGEKSLGATGKTGESLKAVKQADGTYSIIGATTGDTYAEGLASSLEANQKMTELNAGFAEPIPETYGLTRVLNVDELNTLADAGLTEDDIVRDGEDIYLKDGITLESLSARTLDTTSGASGTSATSTTSSASSSSTATAELTSALESSVAASEAAATAADPTLEVTEEMRAAWLEQAYSELANNTYYQEVIRNAEFDLGTSLNRLVADTRLRELALVQNYKENLTDTQQSLKDRGMLFGGVRQGEERTLADKTNLELQAEEQSFLNSLQDINLSGERYFGSDYAATLAPKYGTTQSVGRVIEGSPVFSTGADISLFTPMGGNYGSFPLAIDTAAEDRALDIENSFTGEAYTY